MKYKDIKEASMMVSLDDMTKQRIIFSGVEYDPHFDLMTPANIKKELKKRVDMMIRKSGFKVASKSVGVKSFDLFFNTKDDLNQFSKKHLTSSAGIKAGITVKTPTIPDIKKDKKQLDQLK